MRTKLWASVRKDPSLSDMKDNNVARIDDECNIKILEHLELSEQQKPSLDFF